MKPEKISVTVTVTAKDGCRTQLVFDLDPTTFQMNQSREKEPVYDPDQEVWGKPVEFIDDPNRKGTQLSIFGSVIGGGLYKWPE